MSVISLEECTPELLRRLDREGLDRLAADIRALLISSVARHGGHLGSNLGVVELSIALHRVFDSPRDVIVWDTGHQAYVHKMLTGRAGGFDRLRLADGVSGYPNHAESVHDWVENSHAGTSLSYAAGLVGGLPPLPGGSRRHVVTVTGDGSLTAGMALEALNDLADRRLDVTIILNDNGRSYAPTTGALARHLQGIHDGEGSDLLRALGVGYFGPVDGHDVEALEQAFAKAAAQTGPQLVHVRTQKGRGYAPALAETTEHMHGVGPFDARTGRQLPLPEGRVATGSVVGPCLVELADQDSDLVVITPAMGGPSGLDCFRDRFPDRFFDVGIAEQHAVGLAAGLAMAGRRPVVSIHSSFLNRALDQLLFDVGLHRLPVVLVIDRAGITGGDGPSHHGLADLALLRQVPGMAIATAATAGELRGLLRIAARFDGPVAIRHGKAIDDTAIDDAAVDGMADDADLERWTIEPEPDGVLVIGAGDLLASASAVVDGLRGQGIPAGLANARWIEPLDGRLPQIAAQHRLLAVIEDHWNRGGLGSAVREALAEAGVEVPVRVYGVPHGYLRHGAVPELRGSCGLDPRSVLADLAARWLGTRLTEPAAL